MIINPGTILTWERSAQSAQSLKIWEVPIDILFHRGGKEPDRWLEPCSYREDRGRHASEQNHHALYSILPPSMRGLQCLWLSSCKRRSISFPSSVSYRALQLAPKYDSNFLYCTLSAILLILYLLIEQALQVFLGRSKFFNLLHVSSMFPLWPKMSV